MKLYEINEEIQQILEGAVDEETGEVLVDFEALDALVEAREAKVTSCGLYYLNRQAEMAAVKAEIDRLTKRYKRLAAQNASLLGYMERNMNGDEFSCPQFNIKYSKSTIVEVDEQFIDWALKTRKFKGLVRTKHEPDKVAIAALLKAGETLTHAKLETRSMMKIK